MKQGGGVRIGKILKGRVGVSGENSVVKMQISN